MRCAGLQAQVVELNREIAQLKDEAAELRKQLAERDTATVLASAAPSLPAVQAGMITANQVGLSQNGAENSTHFTSWFSLKKLGRPRNGDFNART